MRKENLSDIIVILMLLVIASFGIFTSPETQHSENYYSGSTSISLINQLGLATGGATLRVYTENTEIPLKIEGILTNFTIDADVGLKNDNSLVRVILVDNQNNEHLVYEVYPLKAESNTFSITGACEETCVLTGITASSLKIILVNASIRLKSGSLKAEEKIDNNARVSLALKSDRIRGEKRAKNIETVNKRIKDKGLTWIAGETSVSKMSYEEKKKLFPKNEQIGEYEVPNLQGFEYYKGGVFSFEPNSATNKISGWAMTTYPQIYGWDWRVAHGENWMTPVRDQGQCGSCWVFGVVGALEGSINAYYNQHLNINISEQDAVCSRSNGCDGGWPQDVFGKLQNTGITEEKYLTYSANSYSCTKTNDWSNGLWKIAGYTRISDNDNAVKKALKDKGPLSFLLDSWNHEMTLVGYEDHPNGQTVWIFKNSWGTYWGEYGYARMTISETNMDYIYATEKPYLVPLPGKYTKKCVDKDGDTYCNWGIGTKPSTCPTSCKAIIDCDDSNKSIGGCDTVNPVKVPLNYKSSVRCYTTTTLYAGPYCVALAEICNGQDDDNDGLTDEGCDDDKDYFTDNQMECPGCSPGNIDLNDSNPKIGSEKCNNIDDDYDRIVDNGCDDDRDGLWDPEMICEGQYLAGNGQVYPCSLEYRDPDETTFTITKLFGENCNNKDDDGDGLIDEGCDDDKDAYFDNQMLCLGMFLSSDGKTHDCGYMYIYSKVDWNDTNPRVNSEKCNLIDDDQNGYPDTGCDDDKDGFWDGEMTCEGYFLTYNGGIATALPCSGRKDPNDSDPAIPSTITEKCNNLDDNKNGIIDEGCDDDKDTYWDGNMICDGMYRAGKSQLYPCDPEMMDLDDNSPDSRSVPLM